ncbi:hypothetical protein ONA02_06140 [Mycoplasmopsis felis]|uniref:hypothetical protein n=1 Tax=Mycoplasmopsis felis TaxID=33923 RepID=UPI0022863FF6|nr:hypothetical protein [Mycoplasmopsis felis]WAM02146.1 hypothetical protein ONA02_06140 [Mycoplasmopsis felis]
MKESYLLSFVKFQLISSLDSSFKRWFIFKNISDPLKPLLKLKGDGWEVCKTFLNYDYLSLILYKILML